MRRDFAAPSSHTAVYVIPVAEVTAIAREAVAAAFAEFHERIMHESLYGRPLEQCDATCPCRGRLPQAERNAFLASRHRANATSGDYTGIVPACGGILRGSGTPAKLADARGSEAILPAAIAAALSTGPISFGIDAASGADTAAFAIFARSSQAPIALVRIDTP